MLDDKLSLDGRVVVVTGAGRGLGRAMSVALADAGADVVAAARTAHQLEQTAELVRARGRRCLVVPTDVTESAQCDALIRSAIDGLGRVDVLVNNAGGGGAGWGKGLDELTDDEWRQGMDTNITSCFYCTRAVIEHMRERRSGKIVNIASGNGMRGQRNVWMYSVAKAGMINFTRSLAISYGAEGIQAICLVPGLFPHLDLEASARIDRVRFIPVGRAGLDSEIGELTALLASDATSYLNGEVVVLDGGGLAQGHAPTGFAPLIPIAPDDNGGR